MQKRLLHPIIKEIQHEARIAKFGEHLLKIHEALITKMDRFEQNIAQQKGPKGDMPSQEQIRQSIQEVLPYAIRSIIPELKSYISTLVPVVKNGETPTDDRIVSLIKKNIPAPTKTIRIKEQKQLSGEEIYSMIYPYLKNQDAESLAKLIEEKIDLDKIVGRFSGLPKGKKIKVKDIDGLEQTIKAFSNQLGKGYLHGGGDTVKAGSGITITANSNGTKTIAAATGTPEIPQGVVDGVNNVFTFSVAPTIIVVDQGRTLINGSGYTLIGTVATLDVAPAFSVFSI